MGGDYAPACMLRPCRRPQCRLHGDAIGGGVVLAGRLLVVLAASSPRMTTASPSVVPNPRPPGSDRVVLWFGLVLGLVLTLALGWVIANDRQSRLNAAQRQASDLASGTER